MIVSKQEQTVGDSSLAVQAHGSVTVNQGPSAAQIAEIITALGEKIGVFEQRAKEIVDQRLTKFKEDVLREFATKDGANSEAFADPDFQYAFHKAQQAYVRNSDENIAEALVNMIAERSTHLSRDRVALIMNSAIETSAELTREEFSELSLLFLLRRTKMNAVKPDLVFKFFEDMVRPFVDDCSLEESSYDHLVTNSCAIMDVMGSSLADILTTTYGGAFAKECTRQELEQAAPLPQADRPIAIHEAPGSGGKFRLSYVNLEEFDNALKGAPNYETAKALYQSKLPNADEIVQAFRKNLSWFNAFEEVWNNTLLQRLSPTSKGIVIAHSNIKRALPEFSAPLSIWVR